MSEQWTEAGVRMLVEGANLFEQELAASGAAAQKYGELTDQVTAQLTQVWQDAEQKVNAYVTDIMAQQAAMNRPMAPETAFDLAETFAKPEYAKQAQKQSDEIVKAYAAEQAALKQKQAEAKKAADEQKRLAEQQARDAEAAAKAQERATQQFGLYVAALGAGLTLLARSWTMVAARNEELQVAMQAVGENAGHSRTELAELEGQIKELGITTSAARTAMMRMMQADIDLANATKLARIAQDAAVIAQMDSSQAYESLITAIQRGQLRMLRTLGINTSFEKSYADMAAALGKTTNELTEQEKVQARVNAVVEAGKKIEGTYEAAMGTAGKQARSLKRYHEELADQMGQSLLPVYGAFVRVQTDIYKGFLSLPTPIKDTLAQMTALTGGVLTLTGATIALGPKIGRMAGMLAGVSGLGPLGIAAAGLAIPAAVTLYFANAERARRAEAASILEASKSYPAYLELMHQENLERYDITAGIYAEIKARQDLYTAKQVEAAREVAYNAIQVSRARGLEIEQLAKLDDLTLIFLSDQEFVTQALMKGTKWTEEDVAAQAELIVQLARTAEDRRRNARNINESEESIRNAYRQTPTVLGRVLQAYNNLSMAMQTARSATEALATAQASLQAAQLTSIFTLAEAMSGLADLAQQVDDAEQQYEDSLTDAGDAWAKAQADRAERDAGIASDYQTALGKLNSYDVRYAAQKAELDKETAEKYADSLKSQGDAYSTYVDARNEATDRLKKEEEKATESQADLLLQTALTMAEQTGQLKDWEDTQAGIFHGTYLSADQVFKLLKGGMLDLGDLTGVLQTYENGLAQTFDTAQAQMEENQATAGQMAEQAQAEDQDRLARIQAIQAEIAQIGVTEGKTAGFETPEELAAHNARMERLRTLQGELTALYPAGGVPLTQDAAMDKYFPGFRGAFDTVEDRLAAIAQAWQQNIDQVMIPATMRLIEKILQIPAAFLGIAVTPGANAPQSSPSPSVTPNTYHPPAMINSTHTTVNNITDPYSMAMAQELAFGSQGTRLGATM